MITIPQDQHAHLAPVNEEEIFKLNRPHKNLLKLFVIYSLTSLIFFPFVMIPMYFRYHTLRYKFDSEGISIAYGIFWRRESYVTYSRIQDIHVTRNIFERWLGLGTVAIQTASGSANSEESISGMMEFEQIRNFLYARMRGIHSPQKASQVSVTQGNTTTNEELTLLESIRDEIRATRQALERKHNA
ncbi:MAG: PH domain-containing protein [Ignavibacteria bacterium]|nr:PH domain-containing protein [Ignavibacteria bacterium]